MRRVTTKGGRFGWLNTLSTTRSISCGAVSPAGTVTPLSSVLAAVSWRLAVGVAISSPSKNSGFELDGVAPGLVGYVHPVSARAYSAMVACE